MATYYWRGGTGTWDNASSTNWSLTSGGTGGAGIPTTADDVIFNSLSDTGTAFTVTIGTGAACRDFTVTAPDVVMTLTVSGSISVAGSLSWPATNLTVNAGTMAFTGTGTHTITASGKSIGNCTFSGTGSWTLIGSVSFATMSHINGTIDFGSSTATGGYLNSTGTNIRTINLSTSTVSLSGSDVVMNISATNLTFNAGTSTLNFTFGSGSINTPTLSYYNINFSGMFGANYVFEAASCNNMVLAANTDPIRIRSIQFSRTTPLTINGTLALNGSAAANSRARLIYGTLSINAVTGLSNIDFVNCSVSGAAAPLSGTYLGNAGGNTGINFTAGRNIYWVGGTGGSTDLTRYAATSGGAGSSANFPLPQDTLIVDNNSGASGSQLSTDSSYLYGNIDLSSRTATFSFYTNRAIYVVGNFTQSSVTTVGGSLITFYGSSNQTITQNGNVFNGPVQILKPAGGTVSLGGPFTIGGTLWSNYLEITGAFTSNSYDIAVPVFTVMSTVAANINLGTSTINVKGDNTNTTVLSALTLQSNTTLSAGATFNITGATVLQRSISLGLLSEATVPNVNITNGAGTTTISGYVKNLSNVGFTGIFNGSATVYGNMTYSAAATNNMTCTFAATSGTKTITTNGATVGAVTFNGVGGTWQLQDNLTTSGTLTLTNGTLDLNNKTASVSNFLSSYTSIRSLLFGTSGVLNLTSTTGGSIWNTSVVTNLSLSGSRDVRVTGVASLSRNFTAGSLGESSVPNITAVAGAGSFNPTGAFGDFNLTGFTGTLNNSNITIYGSLNIPTGMAYISGGVFTFAATSGTKTINTSGINTPFAMVFNGVGGTWQLGSNISLTDGTATYSVTLTNGTLNLNNFNANISTFSSNNSNVRSLNFGTSQVTVVGSGTSAWNVATSTNFTVTHSAGAKISMPSATAKTFAGGGKSYPLLEQSGTGALTISGSNSFTDITNTVQPTTVSFTGATTQTFGAFNLRGTAGNLVTIGSTTTSAFALSAPSGVIVDVDYLSISRSTATGGAAWYAGANSTNGGNNVGWTFTATPTIAFATSVTSTGAIGTVTVGQGTGAFPTSVTGTGVVGNEDITTGSNAFPTGVVGTTALGTAVAEVAVVVSGVQATASLNSVILFTNNFITPNGVQGTTQLGQEAAAISINATPTGVQASALVNSVTSVLGSAVVSPVKVTGTGAVGFVSIDADGGVGVVGNVGTGLIGNETVLAGANAYPTGVSAQIYLGTSAETGSTNVFLTGTQGLGQTGTLTTTTVNIFSVTGVQGLGRVGTVGIRADQIISITGVLGTTYLGTSNIFNVTNVTPYGVYGTGYIGSVSISGNSYVYPIGVQGDTVLGETAVWITVDDNQNGAWAPISSISSSSWDTIPTSGNG